MSSPPSPADEENVLSAVLTRLNNQIQELELRKRAIEIQINESRRANLELKDVKRTSSVNRSIIERHILDILKSAKGDVKSRNIEIQLSGKYTGVKPPTFRSYLCRMREREIITSTRHGYYSVATRKKTGK